MMTGSPFDIDYFKKQNATSSYIESFAQQNATSASDVESFKNIDDCIVSSQVSVAVFLAGVISARFGLWMADLVRAVTKRSSH